MKKGYTHLSILLDRSGSMESIKKSIIEGFNSLINDQKKEEGEFTISLIQFDSGFTPMRELYYINNPISQLRYNSINNFSTLDKVQLLNENNYVPDGGTPLNDAIVRLIKETGDKLASLNEDDRPEKVIVVVLTDGQENSSTQYTTEDVRKMIEHQEKVYNWKFIYVGTNQDVFAEASARKMSAGLGFSYDRCGVKGATIAISKTMSKMRSMDVQAYSGMDLSADLSQEYDKAIKEDKEAE